MLFPKDRILNLTLWFGYFVMINGQIQFKLSQPFIKTFYCSLIHSNCISLNFCSLNSRTNPQIYCYLFELIICSDFWTCSKQMLFEILKRVRTYLVRSTLSLIRFRVSVSWMDYTPVTTKTEDPSNMTTMDRLDRSTATKRIECPLVYVFEIKRSDVTLEA